jgi:hypothetical protein
MTTSTRTAKRPRPRLQEFRIDGRLGDGSPYPFAMSSADFLSATIEAMDLCLNLRVELVGIRLMDGEADHAALMAEINAILDEQVTVTRRG